MGTLVVGVDGSEGAQLALEWAARTAASLDHVLCPVYVQRYEWPPEHVTIRAVGPVLPSLEDRRRAAEEVLDRALGSGPCPRTCT